MFLGFCNLAFGQNTQSLDSTLQALMDRNIKNKGRKAVHNIQLSLNYQDQYIFHGSAGLDKKNGQPMTDLHQFKIASVTKTFTAVIILQMVEEGQLKLDDLVSEYLDKELIETIHIYKGKSYGNQITIEQLLGHTSGLADYFFDDWRFLLGLKINPRRSWTPDKILGKFYKHRMNKKAKFAPGTSFHYSDTNYLLLGLIIEKLNNASLASQYRSRIIEPLNMDYTYFDIVETGTDKLMHQYMNGRNVTKNMNTSMDWAGGGLVSTTRDLTTFIKALFNCDLFENKSTLDLMLPKEGSGYGLGLSRSRYHIRFGEDAEPTLFLGFGHTGFWGVYMRYIPSEDISLVYSIGQVNAKGNYGVDLGGKPISVTLKEFGYDPSKKH